MPSNTLKSQRAAAGLADHALRALSLMASALLFALGLVAPLTPSEGRPSLAVIAIFVGLPLALSIAVGVHGRVWWRLIAGGQALLIALVAIWLLFFVLRHPAT